MSTDDDEMFTRELLQGAGRRPSPPDEDLAAITAKARVVWEERYARKRSYRRWILPIAAALAIVIGLAVWTSTRRPIVDAPAAVVAATVERVTGSVALTPGESLFAGSLIETKDDASRVSLRLTRGHSLRLDAATRVRLVSPTLVELQRGGLYVDSMGSDQLTIRTAAGLFTPVGTQFEVRVGGDATTQLRVREGRVAFHHERTSDVAAAGDELSIAADGKIARARVRPDDPQWRWAVDVASMPSIEGRTLDDFLRHCAREKGWTLEYASPAAAALASKTILHGSVDSLSLDDSLRTVAMSSGVRHRLRDGVLIITTD
jgi:ferric-dicitrate binding protein FerR (iron transport regulator)